MLASLSSANSMTARLKMTDRKSTRLNSSHSQISYAVFCLKKKKTVIDLLHRQAEVGLGFAAPDLHRLHLFHNVSHVPFIRIPVSMVRPGLSDRYAVDPLAS